ncbi:MAG: hypothetical protein HeimC2_21090 [Candidatus Heimdallarchaeota archaeon LC_2]|nr:MAG: hypothetical protein HeimC2_21090 [Candidatus Heimdallarchaeota archaeon LC_2]
MVHNHHSHHDPNSSNYSSHVMNFRSNDFCIGCLGSKFFLILVLPILIRTFIYPNVLISPIIDWTIILILWTSIVTIYVYEYLTGKIINNYVAKIFTSTYLFGLITYVLVLVSQIDIGTSRVLMLLFAAPQIGIYVFKIIRKEEFIHKKTKLFVRLLFIISFFFSLINFSTDIFGSLIVIFTGSLIFIRSKNFSEYRIGNDKYLVSVIDANNNSRFSKIIKRLKIFDNEGKIKIIEEKTSFFDKSYFVILVGILYFAGFILVTSNNPLLSNCNNEVVKSVVFSTPWIIAKSDNQKYCTNCGETSPKEFRFCESCGTQFQMQEQGQSNIPQQDSYYPPQDNIFQGNRGYSQQGYQPYGGQQHSQKDERKSIPVFVGIAVFLIVTLGTGVIVLGLLLGVVGYFGTKLAMSTNNPCLSYCIMNQLCNCICSTMNSSNRRRGNF